MMQSEELSALSLSDIDDPSALSASLAVQAISGALRSQELGFDGRKTPVPAFRGLSERGHGLALHHELVVRS